jgi:DNA polymerase-3 subunit beta
MNGSFTAPAGALVSAVKYTARWLDTRPANPVLGGLLFEVGAGRLAISSQSELATGRALLAVEGDAEGRFVVAGRLIDQIVGTFPDRPVTFMQDGPDEAIVLTAGKFRATLPPMSEKDYPDLARVAPTAGVINGAALIDAVRRVGIGASRDDSNRIWLTGIQVTFDDDPDVAGGEMAYTVSLAATDTYRAVREVVEWSPNGEAAPIGESFVVPASVLIDAGEAFGGLGQVEIGWREGAFSLSTATRSLVTQTIGEAGKFPPVADLLALHRKRSHIVTVAAKALAMPLKRADMLAGGDFKHVTLELSAGRLGLRASGEGKGDGGEEVEAEYDGPDCSVITRSEVLHGILATAPGGLVELHLNPGSAVPVYATSPSEPNWTHLFMPIRHT